MTTRTFTTGNADIDALMDRAYAVHAANGTDVRCPTCNAPAGVFCVVPGSPSTHEKYRSDDAHAERLALAKEQ
jgi:hypothetical protein